MTQGQLDAFRQYLAAMSTTVQQLLNNPDSSLDSGMAGPIKRQLKALEVDVELALADGSVSAGAPASLDPIMADIVRRHLKSLHVLLETVVEQAHARRQLALESLQPLREEASKQQVVQTGAVRVEAGAASPPTS